jgi:hypothetical protein
MEGYLLVDMVGIVNPNVLLIFIGLFFPASE